MIDGYSECYGVPLHPALVSVRPVLLRVRLSNIYLPLLSLIIRFAISFYRKHTYLWSSYIVFPLFFKPFQSVEVYLVCVLVCRLCLLNISYPTNRVERSCRISRCNTLSLMIVLARIRPPFLILGNAKSPHRNTTTLFK